MPVLLLLLIKKFQTCPIPAPALLWGELEAQPSPIRRFPLQSAQISWIRFSRHKCIDIDIDIDIERSGRIWGHIGGSWLTGLLREGAEDLQAAANLLKPPTSPHSSQLPPQPSQLKTSATPMSQSSKFSSRKKQTKYLDPTVLASKTLWNEVELKNAWMVESQTLWCKASKIHLDCKSFPP